MNNDPQKADAWHEEAMDLAEMAMFALRGGGFLTYWKFIQQALNYEKAAARTLSNQYAIEPSRSILYKGATHLALNLDRFEEARLLLNEAIAGNPPDEIDEELNRLLEQISKREKIKSKVCAMAQGLLEGDEVLTDEDITKALNVSLKNLKDFFDHEDISELTNPVALKVSLQTKNLVSNPDYQIFEEASFNNNWIIEKKGRYQWSFWKAYKIFLEKKGFASTTIRKLDILTDDVLARIGDPSQGVVWDKRGLIVGDVQSGKTSNYIGLINKAADVGFRIVIVLTGLYESLRQQTQERIDEGFLGFISDSNSPDAEKAIGVELYRKPSNLPVQPITKSGEAGDLSKNNLPNRPIKTNDYYAIVIKKNPAVLKALLTWLYARGENDGVYKIIRNIPLLVIDDEADYASINVDKEFVSKINGSIRAILALFEQSAFVGYTATPFANVFISDVNETTDKEILIAGRKFRLGEDLFPRDFIINLPPPSNYIGYNKVFNTSIDDAKEESVDSSLPMLNIITDYEREIPKGHRKEDPLPTDIPPSLKYAVKCFVLVCAARLARGQNKEHNSMLVHVSWYVQWIDSIAFLLDKYRNSLKEMIISHNYNMLLDLQSIWNLEFRSRTKTIITQLKYDDPGLIEHEWDEILPFLIRAVEKIEVRAIHGTKKNIKYKNITPLNYYQVKTGLSIIAVGGNKLSRGLTLEGLSISYFLRATRFYDTLLQMGRWFGYRPGYVDLCRLFTTEELVLWYQYIGNATEELKEQFDIMDLADRTPKNFGLKVRSAPGMLMISSAAKIKGATDLSLSYSGELRETYILPKSQDAIISNLLALNHLIEKLGVSSGKIRQGQSFIWENVSYRAVEEFLVNYKSSQASLNSTYLRNYINHQQKNGNLINWNVVLITNTQPKNSFEIKSSHSNLMVGCTFRKEVLEKDASGNSFSDPNRYFIRQSHIISPPHEYLDMDENDPRYQRAKADTIANSKGTNIPTSVAGKYIRKYRGSENVLLLVYILDWEGFGGKPLQPAIGFAISFPEIKNDFKIQYKVNQQFVAATFDVPADAEENPEIEED